MTKCPISLVEKDSKQGLKYCPTQYFARYQ